MNSDNYMFRSVFDFCNNEIMHHTNSSVLKKIYEICQNVIHKKTDCCNSSDPHPCLCVVISVESRSKNFLCIDVKQKSENCLISQRITPESIANHITMKKFSLFAQKYESGDKYLCAINCQLQN